MTYDEGLPETEAYRYGVELGLTEGLKDGTLAWADGPEGRRLVVTEAGMRELERREAEVAVSRGVAHWR